jgi:murein DD-endopeptidase MepM/ murein hydrolase activator NlpD
MERQQEAIDEMRALWERYPNDLNYQTLYAHMSKAVVKPGQKVKRGQLIGYVGSTGMSSGSHLHYEVIKNGQPVNPIYYFYIDITPEEYNSLLESSKKVNQALS